MGWGQAKEPAGRSAGVCQNYPLVSPRNKKSPFCCNPFDLAPGTDGLLGLRPEKKKKTKECISLPRGKYGCTEVRVYPAECGQQLGRDPSKIGSSKSLVLKSFSAEGTQWDSSLLVPLTLWDTPALFTPVLPLPQISPSPGKGGEIAQNGVPAISSICYPFLPCCLGEASSMFHVFLKAKDKLHAHMDPISVREVQNYVAEGVCETVFQPASRLAKTLGVTSRKFRGGGGFGRKLSDSVKRHLRGRHLSVFEFKIRFYFPWWVHPRRTNCTLTKAASIPARRQRA